MKAAHLVRRFFGALRPGPPRAADREWVAQVLTASELGLWNRMPNQDRRHSVAVTRRVQAQLREIGEAEDRRWLAASLLHDVGKVDAGLGVYGRVVATLAVATAGRDTADAWVTRRGFTRRVGLYVEHPRLGADMIHVASGTEEAAQWAAAHHDPDAWDTVAIPRHVVEILVAADDD